MRDVEFWILSYLLNSLWQIPLLFAAGWLAARALRPAGAEAEHRVWVTTLTLQCLLPAGSIFPIDWLHSFSLLRWNATHESQAYVSVTMGGGTGAAPIPLPGFLLGTAAVLYVTVIAYFAARFLWRGRNLSLLRRETAPVQLTGDAALFWARCCRRFAIENVSIADSSRVFSPVTMGLRRKLLLLPVAMVDVLPNGDLETVIAHEFAHMQRNDFVKNLFYELLSLPVAYHPLFWTTRARVMESREMICDQMAADMSGPNEYAGSLLRIADLLVPRKPTPHTLGIFDTNVFERRLMNLTEKHKEIHGVRRMALVAACAVLGLATCGTALALGMHANAVADGGSSSSSKAPKQITVSAKAMSGNLLTKAVPVYPPAAKKAKIQGTVVLSVVIGDNGNVENIQVISGPEELQQSSIDAVRQWTYKPYLLNGNPVEVKTTVNIIYSLQG
jgi:bla regulator protein blaR1